MTHVADPIAAMYRANQAFHTQVLDTAALSCGVAHFSKQFPGICNQFREVSIPQGGSAEAVWEEVEAFFGRRGEDCTRWVPAVGQLLEPLEEFLRGKLFLPSRKLVMALRPWPELPPHPQVRIVPGRGVRQVLRDLIMSDKERGEWATRDSSAELVLLRLDDPGFEMLVGMVEGKAVGHGGMLEVGPIAAIYDVFVQPKYRRRGVARALMADLVNACRRLQLRTVVLEVDEANTAAIALYEQCGFERAGTSVEFVRPRS